MVSQIQYHTVQTDEEGLAAVLEMTRNHKNYIIV